MIQPQCICDCDICYTGFKVGDIIEVTNKNNESDIGIIVKINEKFASVSMKKFKGDYELIFNINNSENVKKRKDIKKEELINYFGNWWIKEHNYI